MTAFGRYLVTVFLASCAASVLLLVGVLGFGWPAWLLVPVAYGGILVLMVITTTLDTFGGGPGGRFGGSR